ncbi:MAG: bifunctional methylenetetrahydrofolate dehydrogenase/methenyltetrahydrofolate cyclohydrolase FolD [Alphaproteobacteria bacterium]|nr:bifunctional methylenetetrahydrofolate dehydrogenase/methenyltetrahydrofolate cyclohydrolase FolD [Alphaproteobacteria bacterium]
MHPGPLGSVGSPGARAGGKGLGRTNVIDGSKLAAALRQRVGEIAAQLHRETGIMPGLATVLVGEDPASQVYIRSKGRACTASGIAAFDIRFPLDVAERRLVAEVERLNRDGRIDGILVQLPLPAQIDAQRIISVIDPAKDVDGFHPFNIGRLWSGLPTMVPCTPQGCLRLLRTVHDELSGADAVILGRSNIVGKPLAALLVAANCTVTMVHSRTKDIPDICRRADILIAAAGRPRMVGAGWIKPDASVIDVGINPVVGPDGRNRVVGDVDYEPVAAIAGAITPVPGGVGPMTIACLLLNTLLAACRRRGLPDPLL